MIDHTLRTPTVFLRSVNEREDPHISGQTLVSIMPHVRAWPITPDAALRQRVVGKWTIAYHYRNWEEGLLLRRTEESFQPRQHELHPHRRHNEPHKASDRGLRAPAKPRPQANSKKQNRKRNP